MLLRADLLGKGKVSADADRIVRLAAVFFVNSLVQVVQRLFISAGNGKQPTVGAVEFGVFTVLNMGLHHHIQGLLQKVLLGCAGELIQQAGCVFKGEENGFCKGVGAADISLFRLVCCAFEIFHIDTGCLDHTLQPLRCPGGLPESFQLLDGAANIQMDQERLVGKISLVLLHDLFQLRKIFISAGIAFRHAECMKGQFAIFFGGIFSANQLNEIGQFVLDDGIVPLQGVIYHICFEFPDGLSRQSQQQILHLLNGRNIFVFLGSLDLFLCQVADTGFG